MEGRTMYESVDVKEVIDGRHPPVIFPMIAKSNQGIIPAGCVLAKDSDGKIVPYEVSEEDMTGVVDGTNKAFTLESESAPLLPGTIVLTHGDVELTDNGFGVIGGVGGAGVVDYASGVISVTFGTAPADESDSPKVEASRAVVGVALRPANTSREDVISVVVHGTVLKSSLVLGVDSDAVSQVALDALEGIAIYATL